MALAQVAARLFREERVDQVFHLGDVTDPETLAPFDGVSLVVVRGNNDEEAAWPTTWRGELAGVRLGATHGHRPDLLRALAAQCDVVAHGHTHARRAERVGSTLFVNPGALHRARQHTVAILELPRLSLAYYEVRIEGARPIS